MGCPRALRVAALAGYLGCHYQSETETLQWLVEQGVEMGRPSLIEVEAEKEGGEIIDVRVGGNSVIVS